MSTLEKAIGLLQEMPENQLEAVYMYICFVDSQSDSNEAIPVPNKSTLEKRQRGFQGLMSFAGTLPEDFDYRKELEEVRDDFSDFEDCLQDECAKQIHADYIVTRNINDFSTSDIPAIIPDDLLKILDHSKGIT